MNRIYIILLSLALCLPLVKGANLDLRADSAYMADQFAEAAALYEEAAREEGVSSDLYYNLGNCYYRMGKTGEAIVAYERALRLNPSNSDARTNLDFLNSRIVDRPGDRGSFISNTADDIALSLPSNSWAWIAAGIFFLVVCCAGAYVFAGSVVARKAGFFSGIILLILCIFAAVMSFRGARISTDMNQAIITVPSTILSTSPRAPKDRNEEAMLLHEGTKVKILDSVTSTVDTTKVKWYDVEVDNTHRAWVDDTAVTRI